MYFFRPCSRPLSSGSVFILAALLVASSALAPRLSAQQTSALIIKEARVGVGGKCKAGFWAPVHLLLEAGPAPIEGEFELVIPDGDQVPVVYSADPPQLLRLDKNEKQTISMYAKIGPVAAPITARLRTGDKTIWSQELMDLPPRLASTQTLVVSLGPRLGIEEAVTSIKRAPELAFASGHVGDASQLPDRWWGYEGVNAIVLATGDPRFTAAMSPDQRSALRQWVRMGGHLIASVGAQGESLLTDESWRWLAPGSYDAVSPVRELVGLESFAANELPDDDNSFQRNRPLATRLTSIRGEVLADEAGAGAGRPLIIRAAKGFGHVEFIAIDLDHPSLAKWNGRSRVLAILLEGASAQREQTETESKGSVTHLGYEDLTGQLRAALDQFSGVTIVNFTTVSVLTLLYLLLIGPGDYLLLARLNVPRFWTWITFPLIALVVGCTAWYFGRDAHGQRVRLNQAEIVDIDIEEGIVRGTQWAHIYSPASRQFDLQLDYDFSVATDNPPQGWLAWQGLPGNSLGGLSSRQPALATPEPYRVSPPGQEARIENLPVQTASSKSLSARWWADVRLDAGVSLARDQYGLLAGEFRNPLPIPLEDCLLAYDERMYRIDSLQPGEKVLMSDLSPLNLEARLTQRRVVKSKDISTPWDEASTDVPLIAQMLMFHEAARGRAYTGLTHHYQGYLDLTQHLSLQRAVLAGRAEQPATSLTSHGEPVAERQDKRLWTWYRLVLPVNPYSPRSTR